mmetsp:Transcript_65399/g.179452  ORF Transcript_65399/g.179452 Transcript_65399/m.179452 type:complete len:214 (-) Transcript_65399:33-674(-)
MSRPPRASGYTRATPRNPHRKTCATSRPPLLHVHHRARVNKLGERLERELDVLPILRRSLEELQPKLRRHVLTVRPLDDQALAEVRLVGDEQPRQRLFAEGLQQPAIPFGARLQRVHACDVVHEDDGLCTLPERGNHLIVDVLPRSVEEVKLDDGVNIRDWHRLHAELDSQRHQIVLGKFLAGGVEHLDERRLAHGRIADHHDLAPNCSRHWR